MANTSLTVTDVNFDGIKANLRSFLQSQSTFEDYDFSSSGMQVILDLLAYNTYHNSIYTNFAHNDMLRCLDTHQFQVEVQKRQLR